MVEPIREVEVVRWENDSSRTINEEVVAEAAVTLYLNGREMVTFLATPNYLEELALGYLLGEGLLKRSDPVSGVQVDADQGWVSVSAPEANPEWEFWGQRLLTSGCGQGSLFYRTLDALDLKPFDPESAWLRADTVLEAMQDFHRSSQLFRRTGGVHGAALGSPGGPLCFREDIGRHNAVDKVAGFCYRQDVGLSGTFLLTSGRISSEIVIKVARLGVTILVSPSAPTFRAVEMARYLGLTLVGFARGRRLNVYAQAGRLVF